MSATAASLEAEIAVCMARLAVVMDDTGPDEGGRPSLEVCSARAAAALDAILRLRALDPVAAFQRLEALEQAVGELSYYYWAFSPCPVWDEVEALQRLVLDFYRALIPGDPAGLVERVFRAVAGTQVRQRGLPPELLTALGRSGREDLVLRIARHHAGPGCWDDERVPTSTVTALLLAEPDSDHLVRTVLEHGLEELVLPGALAERLVAEGRSDLRPVFWLDLALESQDEEDEEDEEGAPGGPEALVARCLAHCEARGLPELAQEVRWCAFDVLFTAEHLRAWLDGVPPDQRTAEAARVLRHVLADEDRFRFDVLRLLLN